jgi:hypothetical protein
MSINLVRMTYRLPLISYQPNTAKIMMKVNKSALKKKAHSLFRQYIFCSATPRRKIASRTVYQQCPQCIFNVLFNSAVNSREYIESTMDG